ncbi:hypothetical protein Hypma_002263 [Hypsizygus marmoreus]|uniref:Uncharacterized protein n=1 Tax=Hypsizygus marmoreus TaxID=39966 RepID=A0A369K3G2_HYPMA|nr:hypothetical protein Hypma_002263 [Hypsizygus marmoreus]
MASWALTLLFETHRSLSVPQLRSAFIHHHVRVLHQNKHHADPGPLLRSTQQKQSKTDTKSGDIEQCRCIKDPVSELKMLTGQPHTSWIMSPERDQELESEPEPDDTLGKAIALDLARARARAKALSDKF